MKRNIGYWALGIGKPDGFLGIGHCLRFAATLTFSHSYLLTRREAPISRSHFNKILPLFLGLVFSLSFVHASEDGIVIDTAQTKRFGKTLRVNAKVVQLSDQKQQIVSRLEGHLEAYHVGPGSRVKRGDAVATLKSLRLSRMSARYLSLKKELAAAKRKLTTTRSLYKKGLASRTDLGQEEMNAAKVEADLNALKTQLQSLGIDPNRLKKPTDTLVVRAHAAGTVSELLVPLHTNVGSDTPIATITTSRGYYAVAYLDPNDALHLQKSVKGVLKLGGLTYLCRSLYLLPEVDEATQRAQLIFAIEKHDRPLLLNAYALMAIDLPPQKPRTAVKRSGLTMFSGEWVLFVPKAETKEEEAHEHEEEHGEEEEHHHHETPPYEPRVVKITAQFGDWVAVEGIRPGEKYVAKGVYFVKSMILKSKLGEHGH